MKKLNIQQQQAVVYNDGPLLIVAGAGTGKTTMITHKIAYIINENIATAENILALTFTDKAAQEMQDRVDELLDTSYSELRISTFHSFCQQLLEEYGLEIGLSNRATLLDDTDAWLLVKQHLYEFKLDYYRPLGNPHSHIKTLLKHFATLKDSLITAQDYIDYAENLSLDKDDSERLEKTRIVELAHAYQVYNQLLRDNNFMDFADLIYYSVELLRTRPNIQEKLKQRFSHIMIDEFQDVNWSQYELIRLLTDETSKLTVVGDDDQSIYAFRGSNVAIILRFKEDYTHAKEIVLTENYRSGQDILDLAYRSIQYNNPDRLEVKLGLDKKLFAKGSVKKSTIEHIHATTIDEEVYSVIQKIIALKKQKKIVWDDIAILARANSHVEPFLHGLEQHGIPYEYLASSGLYKQDIVVDSTAFLDSIADIHNDRAMYRLLRLPFFNMTENDIQKISFSAKKKSSSYYEILKSASLYGVSKDGITIAEKLIALIHHGLKKAQYEKTTTVLYDFLETSSYLKYLTQGEQVGDRAIIRSIYHIKQFLDMIREFERINSMHSVKDFLDHYHHILESGDEGKIYQPDDTADSVNIITIHRSKGLEFKYVFVVNMVEERFPTRKKSSGIDIPIELLQDKTMVVHDAHYEEERRLFYVAMTRAQEGLFFSSAQKYEGNVREKKLSRFLAELDFQTSKTHDAHIDLTQHSQKKSDEKGEFHFEKPTTFSHSQINSYTNCPYQYKLAHILKIPTKSSGSFSFGNTIHNTLQEFYEMVQKMNGINQATLFDTSVIIDKTDSIQVPTEETLLTMYEKKWIPDWYKNKRQREDYYKKGKEILRIFYHAQEGNWTIPLSLEGWFKIKIGDFFINGRIDRIDKHDDGSLEIIDYKTGKSKEKLSTDDKKQLLLYQIAAQTLPQYRHEGPVGKLTFYYVNDNLQTSFTAKNKDIEALQEKLLETMHKIREGNFNATPNPFVCGYCDFKDICEFRKL